MVKEFETIKSKHSILIAAVSKRRNGLCFPRVSLHGARGYAYTKNRSKELN